MPRKKKPYTYFRREDLGITYVYANEDVFDEKLNKYVRKRHMIGKLDEKTNEIIPTAGRGGYRGKKASEEKGNPTEAAAEAASSADASEKTSEPLPESPRDREKYEEEKAAFTEYRQAANARIRELNLKIDQLTVTLEEVQRRYAELCSKVNEAAALIDTSESEQ
jgi:DNA-binding winged helix-turn-helix (wHTH) protein